MRSPPCRTNPSTSYARAPTKKAPAHKAGVSFYTHLCYIWRHGSAHAPQPLADRLAPVAPRAQRARLDGVRVRGAARITPGLPELWSLPRACSRGYGRKSGCQSCPQSQKRQSSDAVITSAFGLWVVGSLVRSSHTHGQQAPLTLCSTPNTL